MPLKLSSIPLAGFFLLAFATSASSDQVLTQRVEFETGLLRYELQRLETTAPSGDLSSLLNQAQMVRSATVRFSSAEEGLALRPFLDRNLTTVTALAAAGKYDEATVILDQASFVLGSSAKRMDIEVVSLPTEAQADFAFYDGTSARLVTTDGVAQRLAIGIYNVKVTKTGYAPVAVPLDLTVESVARIICTLTAEGSGYPSACHKMTP